MNRPAIDYDWPSTSLPAPSDSTQLPADPRLSIVNATEPFLAVHRPDLASTVRSTPPCNNRCRLTRRAEAWS
jgi:hypothetical protein